MHQWCVGSAAKGKWFEHRTWSLNFDNFHKNDGDLQGTSYCSMLSHERSSQYWLIIKTESECFDVLPNISE